MAEQIFTNCTMGGPVFVHVRDGRIISVRPLVFNEKDGPTWAIDVNGRKYAPPPKAAVAPFVLTERARVYSEDRVKYPLKRVDFDPEGNRHPETRGKSGYRRIGWEEALDIVANEMKRIRTVYGPAAITAVNSPHHNFGNIGYWFSAFLRFFLLLGHTFAVETPISWEGWVWGAVHTYGYNWKLGRPEHNDLLEDALKNTELIIHWSNDPESTRTMSRGSSELWRIWLRERGVKQIFIDPYCNYTAAIHAYKWIPLRPDTDAALAMSIAFVWIEEDTYDHEYVAARTYGFEQFKRHIMGEDDGVPKTPEWAENITGVHARVIRALAREWASKKTMLGAGVMGSMGGACRAAYAHEWARLMVLLMAMQGMGKPGVNMWGTTTGAPLDMSFDFPGYARMGINYVAKSGLPRNPVTQKVLKTLIPDAILNPPLHWRGEGFCGGSTEEQFTRHTYPEPGSPEIRMLYRYGGSFIGTGMDTNKWLKAYQSPKIEFVVNQNVFMDPETSFADIVLPACHNFERNDISEWGNCDGYHRFANQSGNSHRVVIYQQKTIEPLYESKSDYEIFSLLAERMGIKEEYTEGNSEEDWIRKLFDVSSLPRYISFEDFRQKGYFVVPFPEDYKPAPAMRWFYEGRACDTDDMNPRRNTEKNKELATITGKIEFVSQSLIAHEPNDEERPPIPNYIPSWEGHTSELARKYPLQMISPHPRYSYHSQYDTHVLWLGDIPGHRVFRDGHYWHTTRIHPSDAEVRGIRNGDIIKIYNDRGAVLGIAQVTERIMPGVIHSYEGSSKYDPIQPGTPGSVDRGGCVNLLTPSRTMSKNTPGIAPNSCLVEVSKWEV
jgi:molybdopterin guanine dinucleotide-containing S/N-oxide reductase-like protein